MRILSGHFFLNNKRLLSRHIFRVIFITMVLNNNLFRLRFKVKK